MKNKIGVIIFVFVLSAVIINIPCAYGQDSSGQNPPNPEMSGQPYTRDRSLEPGQYSGERRPDGQERPSDRDARSPDGAQGVAPDSETKSGVEAAGKGISSEEIDKGLKVTNEEISLDLKGIDLNEFFRIISLRMGITIVVSKGVTGRVNIFLNNLTFDDALDVILISQELACDKKGKVINIMTAAEYERLYGKKYNEKRKLKDIRLKYAKPSSVFTMLSQMKSDIGKIIVDEATGTLFLLDIPDKLELMAQAVKIVDRPLRTEVFGLKYAKSAEMKSQLTNVITGGPGELFTDERTNTLAISDLPDKIKKIKTLIKAFDVETPQVFIEAEIVQVVLNKEYQRGVDWEKIFSQSSLKDLDLIGKFPVSPILSTYQKVSVGKLSRDNYTLALNLVKTYGDTKILSRPRITVLNNQEAKIMVGAREAYVSQTLSQGQSTTVSTENIQFIDVGIKLKVTPAINKDGFVTMVIKPEVSSVRETITTALGSRVPIVETSEAETSVKVQNGAMVMIAGLMKEEKRDETAGFPFLAKIPFIGALFGNHTDQKKNTELIIFITPHIITGDSDFADLEKYIPADIVPEDMQKAIISRKIKTTFGTKKRNAQIKGKTSAVVQEPVKQGKSEVNIQDKIKGMK
jgi:type II secretory pathway component GspD/PulD (secretin)